MRRRHHAPGPRHPETAGNAVTVLIEDGSTHESAVAAAARAASQMTLLAGVDADGRPLIRRCTRIWTEDGSRPVDVRLASLRQIQMAVDVARAYGINFEGIQLAEGRAVVFEPLPDFRACREVRRTQPLVLDLPRDLTGYYEAMLAEGEGRSVPVIGLELRETTATARAVGLVVNAVIPTRHSLDTGQSHLVGEQGLADLARWRADDFRTAVAFVDGSEMDQGTDCLVAVRASA